MWHFINCLLIKICRTIKSKYSITSDMDSGNDTDFALLFSKHIWREKRETDWQEHTSMYTLTKERLRLPEWFLWEAIHLWGCCHYANVWGILLWNLLSESVLHWFLNSLMTNIHLPKVDLILGTCQTSFGIKSLWLKQMIQLANAIWVKWEVTMKSRSGFLIHAGVAGNDNSQSIMPKMPSALVTFIHSASKLYWVTEISHLGNTNLNLRMVYVFEKSLSLLYRQLT